MDFLRTSSHLGVLLELRGRWQKKRLWVVIDQANPDSDFLLDEITDQIEAGFITGNELDALVRELMLALPSETDPRVRESTMNLLSAAYLETEESQAIDAYIVEHIMIMPPAELVHALAILAESSYQPRAYSPKLHTIAKRFYQGDSSSLSEMKALWPSG